MVQCARVSNQIHLNCLHGSVLNLTAMFARFQLSVAKASDGRNRSLLVVAGGAAYNGALKTRGDGHGWI